MLCRFSGDIRCAMRRPHGETLAASGQAGGGWFSVSLGWLAGHPFILGSRRVLWGVQRFFLWFIVLPGRAGEPVLRSAWLACPAGGRSPGWACTQPKPGLVTAVTWWDSSSWANVRVSGFSGCPSLSPVGGCWLGVRQRDAVAVVRPPAVVSAWRG